MSAHQSSPQQVPTYFLQEASRLLQTIDDDIQTLHQNFSIQKAHGLMRSTHTLKGAAATVGLDAIKTTAQILEYSFKALCAPETSLTSNVEGLIIEAYDYLKLLLSGQLDNAPIDEPAILNQMAVIGSKLQKNLGAQFGQTSHLPTAAQLGVDVTKSIFESGVSEYLEELDNALIKPDPAALEDLLRVQAEVFIGLAESFRLPGFGKIAKTTLMALQQHPDHVITIAQVASHDYRAGHAKVLKGDRTRGGEPSPTLIKLSRPQRPSWIRRIWQWLKPFAPAQIHHSHNYSIPEPQKQLLGQLFEQCCEDLERLTKQQGKSIYLQTKGSDILVDPTLVNQLLAPLLYLARHAADCNIEMPAIRQRQGKSTVGKIQLAAKQTEQNLVICVWDDGCGSNPEAIRQQAQHQLTSLHGTVAAAYSPHKGTCFTLKIPIGV